MCIIVHVLYNACGDQKRALDILELKLLRLLPAMLVLGIESGSFTRAASAFNYSNP